jgi:hypothetical protein
MNGFMRNSLAPIRVVALIPTLDREAREQSSWAGSLEHLVNCMSVSDARMAVRLERSVLRIWSKLIEFCQICIQDTPRPQLGAVEAQI